ncbi:MAG: transposase family protein, partial [Chloroflexota bacterium]|nr:transposase family protein [Chloroflexota bacterium]
MAHAARPVPPLVPYLTAVPDPRKPRGKRHPLSAILARSCAAMLAGCDSLLAIAEWGRDPAGGARLAEHLGLTRATTPCVATLHRVFKAIDVAAFERAVGAWAMATEAAQAGDAPDG